MITEKPKKSSKPAPGGGMDDMDEDMY
jgi:hypothetical protein